MPIKKQQLEQLEPDMEQQTCSYCHSAYLIYMQRTSYEIPGWEKYQQPQICRWYHSNGRKSRGSKQPLDMTNLDGVLKSRDIILLTKTCIVKAMIFFFFFGSQVWMWELDHKEGLTSKNWCFWIMMLEKIQESLGLQVDQTSHS